MGIKSDFEGAGVRNIAAPRAAKTASTMGINGWDKERNLWTEYRFI